MISHRSDQILTDDHLRAIGRVCVAWSWLEQHVDIVLATFIPMADLIEARCITANTGLRDKLAMVRSFAFTRISNASQREDLDTLLNQIDNDLRIARNGVVHHQWGFDKNLVPTQYRLKFTYKKPQAHQPKVMESYEEFPTTPDEINKVADSLDEAAEALMTELSHYLASRPPSPHTL